MKCRYRLSVARDNRSPPTRGVRIEMRPLSLLVMAEVSPPTRGVWIEILILL